MTTTAHPRSDTLPPANTPLERMRRRRHDYLTDATRDVELRRDVLRLAFDAPDMAAHHAGTLALLGHDDHGYKTLTDDDARRQYALRWLRTQVGVYQSLARKTGASCRIEKKADDFYFGVAAIIERRGAKLLMEALVPADVTCEMVDTGEVEHIPAQPATTRAKVEKRCPKSIFAGIETEAVAS